MLPVWLVAVIAASARAVTFPKGQVNAVGRSSRSFFSQEIWNTGEEELGVCLRSGDPLLPCITSGAVKSLEAAKGTQELDFGDGLAFVKDNELGYQYEDDLTGDPREATTFFDYFGKYVQQRFLQWDLDFVYPGLLMRVGPSSRGTLHFLMDQRRTVDDRALTTSRLLMKRTLLPVLLGFKMNVISLVPLLIGGLILLIKKALLLSKLSLLVSGLSWLRPSESSQYHGEVAPSFGAPASSYGGGLGSFAGPTKHVIIDRPVDWFGRENNVPLTA